MLTAEQRIHSLATTEKPYIAATRSPKIPAAFATENQARDYLTQSPSDGGRLIYCPPAKRPRVIERIERLPSGNGFCYVGRRESGRYSLLKSDVDISEDTFNTLQAKFYWSHRCPCCGRMKPGH